MPDCRLSDDTAAIALSPAIEAEPELAAFMRAVLAEPALQARLDGLLETERFAAEAAEIASGLKLDLPASAVVTALNAAPSGGRRIPVRRAGWPGPGWRPALVDEAGGAPEFEWLRLDGALLRLPFFSDAVSSARHLPFNRMFRTRTDLDALIAGAPANAPAPDGLIFHMSRCGSTLACQMLAAVPHHTVLAEPEPLDAVARWAVTSGADPDTAAAALRAAIAALTSGETGPERRLFVKPDCWHAPALPLYRAAFPDTPWIFLYREPEAVLASHMRHRGVQTVPGLHPQEILRTPPTDPATAEDYSARVLARICGAALDHWPLGGGMAVNYAELPEAMARRIPAHFGFTPDADEAAAMRDAAGRDSKSPHEAYSREGAGTPPATGAIRDAARAHLRPLYDRLETLRAAQTF